MLGDKNATSICSKNISTLIWKIYVFINSFRLYLTFINNIEHYCHSKVDFAPNYRRKDNKKEIKEDHGMAVVEKDGDEDDGAVQHHDEVVSNAEILL